MTELQTTLGLSIPAITQGAELNQSVKVMHVITDLDVGGAERMMSSYLMSHRDPAPKSIVVSLLPGGYFSDHLRRAGVRVINLNMRRNTPSVRSVFRLAMLIAHEKPDVVQGWMYHADLLTSLALLLSGRVGRTRFYWGVRCSDMDTSKYGFALRLAIWACTWLSWLPDAVIANSFAGRRVHRELGYRARRFLVIPNGVETDRFKPDKEARQKVRVELGIADDMFVLAMIARVDPMKDHATFLDALDKLPGVTAILAGKGTQNLEGRANLHCLGVRDNVEQIYAACDVVVLSSAFGEGFPNVLVEGMACGLAPVATDVGDCAEIMGGIGKIVPPGDSDALADAVRGILAEGKDAVAALGQQSRQRIVEQFSLGRATEAFDRIYFKSDLADLDADPETARQPFLALTSAVVSRLSTFAALIAAARFLNPDDFGAFAVLMAIVGVINAFVSGGGDMWLNSFTASVSGKARQAPRVSHYYLGICAAIACLTFALLGTAILANRLGVFSLGPLAGYQAAIIVAVAGASAAGLFEAQLAVLRAGGRVAAFFWLRDLITPVFVLGLILVVHPSSPLGMMSVYMFVWIAVFLGVFGYILASRYVMPKVANVTRIKPQRWLRLVRHTAGLVYGNLGSRFSIYIDVLVLTYAANLAQVGEYRAAAQFAVGFMVVQHFVFLGLPWQMRRATQAGRPGPGYAWVLYQQRLLLLLSAVAVIALWFLAEPILALLGPRFVAVAPLFQLFVLIRFVDLLWGPNHELLVSNGWTINDAHANMMALAAWGLAFGAANTANVPPLISAVVATAIASLVAQIGRYQMLRRADLIPMMGHPFGPALPIICSCAVVLLAISSI
jgi:glycosyltransferase involved in cell wall biosynthesis/O-antigen/teichoic acid export membrane protein